MQRTVGARRNLCGLLVAGLLLAGCMTTVPKTVGDAGITTPAPGNWREAARKGARKALFDPYTARDVEIAAPVPASMVFDGGTLIPHKGWMICMRANAKNRFGAYTGQQLTGMLIEENGEVETIVTAPVAAAEHCAGAKYEPFAH